MNKLPWIIALALVLTGLAWANDFQPCWPNIAVLLVFALILWIIAAILGAYAERWNARIRDSHKSKGRFND